MKCPNPECSCNAVLITCDLLWCEFCEKQLCECCDAPTDFGHTCQSCREKVVAGIINEHGVERNETRTLDDQP